MALLCAALAIPCRAAPLSEELAAQLGIENLNSEIPLQAKEFADDADLSGLSVGEILGALAAADEAAASAVAVDVGVASTAAVGAGSVAIAAAVSISAAILGAGTVTQSIAVPVA